jgi:hypothetical protein
MVATRSQSIVFPHFLVLDTVNLVAAGVGRVGRDVGFSFEFQD